MISLSLATSDDLIKEREFANNQYFYGLFQITYKNSRQDILTIVNMKCNKFQFRLLGLKLNGQRILLKEVRFCSSDSSRKQPEELLLVEKVKSNIYTVKWGNSVPSMQNIIFGPEWAQYTLS